MKKLVDKINAWWAKKTPEQKRTIEIISTVAGILVGFFGIIGVVYLGNL